ncbi:MAG: TPM domain-containing protein [Pseudomonadota bacterium]
MRQIALFFAALFMFIASPLAAQDFPPLTGRVVDNAGIIPADLEAQLTAELEALETQSQRQLVVVTVPDLQGYDEQTFTYQLGREWGIGDAERNDGAILLVAMEERRVRIEAGYGVEGYLTDAVSSLIIQNDILPRFRDGDFPGGIAAGTQAIIAQLQLDPDEAAQVAQQASEARSSREKEGGLPIGALIWLGFMFFFFILPLLRGGRRRRKYGKRRKGPWGRDDDDDHDYGDGWGRTARDIILWEVGSAIARGALGGDRGGGFGGGFGGGGFGGGGFSGGGGSFGGGGASGGW